MGRNRLVITFCVIILTFSLGLNTYQYSKYRATTNFYNTKFRNEFSDIVKTFELYDGSSMTNESAIKNSVATIASLRSIYSLTTFTKNEELGELLLHLEMFFVLNSNKSVDTYIIEIGRLLTEIDKDLDNSDLVRDLNANLEKQIGYN